MAFFMAFFFKRPKNETLNDFPKKLFYDQKEEKHGGQNYEFEEFNGRLADEKVR